MGERTTTKPHRSSASRGGAPAQRLRDYWTLTRLRRWSVALLVAGAAVALAAGLIPHTCQDAVAESSVVQVCSALSMTDPRVLLFLLIVLILLLPDLSEVELGGVLRLRRTVDETREEARELRRELVSIRSDASATARSELKQTFHFNRPAQTGDWIADRESDGAELVDPGEELGAYAMNAFRAGLAGLMELLEIGGAEATAVGFTLRPLRGMEATHTLGSLPPDLGEEVLAALDRDSTSPGEGVVFIETSVGVVAFAFAFADAGEPIPASQLIGGLAIPLPPDFGDSGHGAPDDRAAAFAAAVEAAAGAYARLLVDLLGERPTLVFRGASGRSRTP